MGSTTTAYQYAGDAVLLEKQGSSTTATYSYGNALLRKDGEYPLCDGLGSARAETSSSQAVTFTVNTDAFGNQIATSGSTGSSYQFAATSGYRNDGDAGLLKVGCRYYDPQLGAFTSRDSYLDQMPYLYCEHDPVNAVDPSGNSPAPVGFWNQAVKVLGPPTSHYGKVIWYKFFILGAVFDLVALAVLPPGDDPISPVITVGTQIPVIVGGVGAVATGTATGIAVGGGAIAIGVGGLVVGGYHFGKWITTTRPGNAFTDWAGGVMAAHGIN